MFFSDFFCARCFLRKITLLPNFGTVQNSGFFWGFCPQSCRIKDVDEHVSDTLEVSDTCSSKKS
ncbi:MAG: hypothetical protein DA408_18475 [Bacteroidetes bacterium]|nr:MAG: hypothetical protein C7N36_13370 [Bacteroidota bacterium]PTM09364.1 MAG: hypothetical protein DA408_18475 [Bacteroidota bacterium]